MKPITIYAAEVLYESERVCICALGAPSGASVSGGSGQEEVSDGLVSTQHVRTPQRPQVLLRRGQILLTVYWYKIR